MTESNHNGDVEEDSLALLIGHLDDEDNEQENHQAAAIYAADAVESRRLQKTNRIGNVRTGKQTSSQQAKQALLSTKVPKRIFGDQILRVRNPFLKQLQPSDQAEDKFLDIKLKERLYSEERVASEFFGQGRPCIRLSDLCQVTEYDDDADFARFGTVAVISQVGLVETSKSTKLPYRRWTLCDLQGTEIQLSLFGDAFRLVSSKAPVACVVMLIDPKLTIRSFLDVNGFRRTERLLSVSKAEQAVVLGKSPHYAKCRIRECEKGSDSSVSVYCAEHAREQLRIVSTNRMALNSSGGAFMFEAAQSLLPKTKKEARDAVNNRHHIDDEQANKRPRQENVAVKIVDGKEYMTDVMKERKVLSAAQRKVAQALKLTEHRVVAPAVGIPVAAQPTTSTELGEGANRRWKSKLALSVNATRMELATSQVGVSNPIIKRKRTNAPQFHDASAKCATGRPNLFRTLKDSPKDVPLITRESCDTDRAAEERKRRIFIASMIKEDDVEKGRI